MILSLVSQLVVAVVLLGIVGGVVALALRALRRRQSHERPVTGGPAPSPGQSVRRFFQYLLLTGLLFAAASGVAGLVGRLLERDPVLDTDESGLALQLTFTIIALPLWAALAWWTRRRLEQDAQESGSLGWAGHLTTVGLVSLVVAMIAWHDVLSWLVGQEAYRGGQVAAAVVWTAVWALHHWWGRAVTPSAHLRTELLLGSLVGLAVAAAGLVQTLTPALRELLGLTRESLLRGTVDDILRGGTTFVVGAAVWAVYWAFDAVRGRRDAGWLALVLLAGVAGGLLAAVVAGSVLGYEVLVWLVGEPDAGGAADHFRGAPGELAVLLVGLVVWWYHKEVLSSGGERRTEVRRVYEYVLAAIGLLAASAGLVMVLVTLVEAIAAGSDLVVGGSALNALLAALVLLAVGLPLWWWHWRQAQRSRAETPVAELDSPTRRTYLLVLFGVAGVVAVVALLSLVYLVLQDALEAGVDVETMRSIRFPIGILATTSLLSAYHWTIFRTDRRATAEAAVAPDGRSAGPRHVLLVGAGDPAVAAEVRERTGAHVQLLRRTDLTAAPWSTEHLVSVIGEATGPTVLVVADRDGVHVIPVEQ